MSLGKLITLFMLLAQLALPVFSADKLIALTASSPWRSTWNWSRPSQLKLSN